jgi:hypothetical protein
MHEKRPNVSYFLVCTNCSKVETMPPNERAAGILKFLINIIWFILLPSRVRAHTKQEYKRKSRLKAAINHTT